MDTKEVLTEEGWNSFVVAMNILRSKNKGIMRVIKSRSDSPEDYISDAILVIIKRSSVIKQANAGDSFAVSMSIEQQIRKIVSNSNMSDLGNFSEDYHKDRFKGVAEKVGNHCEHEEIQGFIKVLDMDDIDIPRNMLSLIPDLRARWYTFSPALRAKILEWAINGDKVIPKQGDVSSSIKSLKRSLERERQAARNV